MSAQLAPVPTSVRWREPRWPFSKRAFDIVVAWAALIVLAPVFAVIAVIVRCTSRGPVIFRQERVGWNEQPFTVRKFRTMVRNEDDDALRQIVRAELQGVRRAEDGSFKLQDDPRVTRIGRWLRKTSIDELPQLLNVIEGTMSIVGPRPALRWETEMFPRDCRRRTDLPPGITGLWQVSGRSRLDTVDMLRLDVEYVDAWSLRRDVSILLRTVPVLLRGDGAR
jgi:lipopolysaccharide/colanic/teichoic acid biosynthesis glycosyltransferase